MDEILKEKLAISLCAADMSCSYIAVNPILDNRDELIENQHVIYKTLLDNIEKTLTPEFIGIEHKVLDQLWRSTIELTAADIISEAISLDPILYDRTEKVKERIAFHFNRLKNCFPFDSQGSIQEATASTENKDVTAEHNENHTEMMESSPNQPHLKHKEKIHYKKHKRHKR